MTALHVALAWAAAAPLLVLAINRVAYWRRHAGR